MTKVMFCHIRKSRNSVYAANPYNTVKFCVFYEVFKFPIGSHFKAGLPTCHPFKGNLLFQIMYFSESVARETCAKCNSHPRPDFIKLQNDM
jgi:hypothetical protein